MKKINTRICWIVFVLLEISLKAAASTTIQVSELKCNHLRNPSGVLANPLFSWQLNSNENAQYQTSYQIIVSSSLEKTSNILEMCGILRR